MFRVLSAIFLLSTTAVTFADTAGSPPSAKPPETECPVGKPCSVKPNGLTVDQCLTILAGLNGLDGHPTPSGQLIPYTFKNGKLRATIQQDIAALNIVDQNNKSVAKDIYKELSKGAIEIKQYLEDGKSTNPVYIEYVNQLNDARKLPCSAPLIHIKMDDLKLDDNEIPGSVLGALDPILDR